MQALAEGRNDEPDRSGSALARRSRWAISQMGSAGRLVLRVCRWAFGAGRPVPLPAPVVARPRYPVRRRFAQSGLLMLTGGALAAAMFLPEPDPLRRADPLRTSAIAAVPVESPPVPREAPAGEPAGPILTLPAELPWLPVKRPVALYNLEAPQLDPAELSYSVALRGRHARRDMLVWTPRAERPGAAGRPHVDLVIERHEQGMPTQRPLYAAIAARAAERHQSLERMAAPAEITSKFGRVQIADAVLAGENGRQACLVFQRIDMIGLSISGVYCAPAGRGVDRVTLGCFIDRLDLVAAGQDRDLRRHFADAERARGTCASARQSGRRITWMDHEAPVPALKLATKR